MDLLTCKGINNDSSYKEFTLAIPDDVEESVPELPWPSVGERNEQGKCIHVFSDLGSTPIAT